MAVLLVALVIGGVVAVRRATDPDDGSQESESRSPAESTARSNSKDAAEASASGADEREVAPERNAAQRDDEAPADALKGADVEYVDCRKRGAPKWCKRIGYATAGERKGTVAVVIRGEPGGEPRWCTWMPAGYRYIGDVGNYVPESVLTELDALAVELVPRGTGPTDNLYFVVPNGTDTSSWKWMGPCPI